MAWMRAAWLAILGSCTPLGLWIYEYPVVTVSRVTLEVSLLLDGIPIGQMRQDSTLPVPTEEVSEEGDMIFGQRLSQSSP